MIRAERNDKKLIVDILSKSFDDNRSVNYIIKQDSRRAERIRALMEYSFDVCHLYGDVFLADNKNGCALLLKPDKKKTSLKSLFLDAKLGLYCIGLSNLKKAIAREAAITKLSPDAPIYYLWFIGVDPSEQGKGLGTRLLNEVIRNGSALQRPVYLETSTLKNIPWYQKSGFRVYNKLDFGYELFCMKKE